MARKHPCIPVKAQRDRIIKLRDKGLRPEQIARMLGISTRTYFLRLAIHGLSQGHPTARYCHSCGINLTWLKKQPKM